MSRIEACFTRLRSGHRRALVPFVTAGDPLPETTVPLLHALVGAGADILELGIPFSDPIADGPIIQKASERALAAGMSLRRALAMVTEFRTRDGVTPIVFMGYLNPFEVMGYADFAEAAARAGVDGVITVDLPPEEAEAFVQCVRGHGMDPIFLLSPTTSDERIAKICAAASGFVYYVSLKGITGASHLDLEAVSRRVTHIKRFTSMPVGVGFGIRDAATSAAIATFADAVVVGSLLVGRIEALRHEPGRICEELSGLVAGMRRAMDEASGIRQ